MCFSAEETTRKQLARGRQLLFPTACSGLGEQQQDAMGEKWLGGPAAALGQSHRTGQGQVGLGFYCRCGLGGCWDSKLIFGLSSATIRLNWVCALGDGKLLPASQCHNFIVFIVSNFLSPCIAVFGDFFVFWTV